VRGHSLSSPEVLRALAPYVVTHWNGGELGEMPEEIRPICSNWKPTRREPSPLLFFVFDAKGTFIKAFEPMPEGRPDHVDQWAGYLLERLQSLAKTLGLKDGGEPALRLPDVKEGIRIFIKSTRPNHGAANYKVPICEVVSVEEERALLKYSETTRTIDAVRLGRWLNEYYPAAIMDATGKPIGLSGSLTLSPAGSDGKKRYAILRGEPEWTMDDPRHTHYRYRGTVEIVLAYPPESSEFVWVRGAIRGSFSKPMGRGAFKFEMTAAIESRPE